MRFWEIKCFEGYRSFSINTQTRSQPDPTWGFNCESDV